MSDNLICFALMIVFLVPFIVSNKKGEILLEFEIENNCKYVNPESIRKLYHSKEFYLVICMNCIDHKFSDIITFF